MTWIFNMQYRCHGEIRQILQRENQSMAYSFVQVFCETVLHQYLSFILLLILILRPLLGRFFFAMQLKHVLVMLVVDDFEVTYEVIDFIKMQSIAIVRLQPLGLSDIQKSFPGCCSPTPHFKIVFVSSAIQRFNFAKSMLMPKTDLRLNFDQKDIIEIGVNPLLQCLCSPGDSKLDLFFQEGVKILKQRENKFSAKGNIGLFPMKHFGVVVEALQYLYFREGPAMDLFQGFIDSHHNIRNVFFEEIDKLFLWHHHFFEFIRVALLKIQQLPEMFLVRPSPKHKEFDLYYRLRELNQARIS